MRRTTAALMASFALVVGLLAGSTAASAQTPNDAACQQNITAPWNSGKLQQHEACHFDKLDAAVVGLGGASPAPLPSMPALSPLPSPF